MDAIFEFVLSFFSRTRNLSLSLFFLLIVVGAFDNYSIISRTDTYFMTENLKRIAEVREQYEGNMDVQKELEKRLQNELSHKNIFENFLSIFNNQKSTKNSRNILWNTLSSAAIFLLFIPFAIYIIFREEKKSKTPFLVLIISACMFLFLLFFIVWMMQWITSLIPTINGCDCLNYIINVLFQLLVFCVLSSLVNGLVPKTQR